MIRQYETTFIIDAHLSTDEIEKSVSKYTDVIGKHEGKVKLIDRWGKRRLAYEIAKKQYGYYVYARFEAEGTVVAALEKDFKLDDTILRYLVLRIPKVVIKDELTKKTLRKPESDEDQKATASLELKTGAEDETEAAESESSSDETDEAADVEEKPVSSE
jgi:small subunit ribosomal protein S6